MKATFYRILIGLSRRCGVWVFRFFTWWVTTGYFVFFPRRLATSLHFYQAVFPQRGLFARLRLSWQQYHRFSRIFLDRLTLSGESAPRHTHEGWENLEEAVNSGTGGIILMSHVGNWEVASRLLRTRGEANPRMRLLLYLGEKHREQIEKAQKESVARSGIRIIAVSKEGGTPADLLEGVQFLKNGGLVSLTGDRLWNASQRTVTVAFFGHEVVIPEAPFLFALLSGAPLFLFFNYRTGKQTCHFRTLPALYVHAANRRERATAIRQAAQFYADRLAEVVREHPEEWFHFEPFLGKRLPS